METILLPFSPRFIVLTICAVVTALLLGIGIVDHKVFDIVLIPMIIFGGGHGAWFHEANEYVCVEGIRDFMKLMVPWLHEWANEAES